MIPPLSGFLPSGPISVTALLSDHQEQAALLRILAHSNWVVRTARNLKEAVAVLGASPAGVIVASYCLPGPLPWHDLLAEARRFTPPPRVVVTDRLADDSMWAEVLNLGAYDLLAQPFRKQEVFRVLSSAWRSWDEESRCLSATGAPRTLRVHAA